MKYRAAWYYDENGEQIVLTGQAESHFSDSDLKSAAIRAAEVSGIVDRFNPAAGDMTAGELRDRLVIDTWSDLPADAL